MRTLLRKLYFLDLKVLSWPEPPERLNQTCDLFYLEVNLRTLEMSPVARLLTLASEGERHSAPSDRPSSAFFCFFRSFRR